MAMKGYHSYRGRQGIWRRLAAVLLVLILIAACAFLLLQRYITYADDGSFYLDLPFEINLNLPFLSGSDDAPDSGDPPEQNVDLIVEEPNGGTSGQEDPKPDTDPDNDPDSDSTPEQEQTGIESYIPRRIIELTELPADAAALQEVLSAAGANGFSFLAKDREGFILYQSAVASERALANAHVSRELLTLLCAQEGIYTVARINCLRDPIFAFENMAEAGICKSNGYVWYENDAGGHWLEAEKSAARDYLIRLALECAELGFDELLLENVCYPYRGNLYKIDYSGKTMSKTDSLVLFLTELNTALEPYSVRISLLLEEDVARGLAENTEDTGFIPQQILPLVDAVYAATSDADQTAREISILAGGKGVPVFIPVVTAANAEDAWYLEN